MYLNSIQRFLPYGRLSLAALMVALFTSGLAGLQASAQTNDVPIHDPVMIKQGDTYYAMGTGQGVPIWSSKDMVTWERSGQVLEETPPWVFDLHPEFRNREWAPDVIFHNGTYYVYYAVSAFGRNNSGIGVATNATMDPNDPAYRWVDQGMVVRSIPGRDMWNAIDASLVIDDEGIPWMNFGSFWGGMKLVKMEDNLTEIVTDAERREWHTIAARPRYWKLDDRDAGDAANPELDYESLYPNEITEMNLASESGAIEAPFIFKKNGWYYLFVSWDRCCRGVESTYKILVGRARDVRGPYLDRAGEKMVYGGGSMVVEDFGTSQRWAAGGHNSAYTFDGIDYLVFHAYDKNDEGRSKLVIQEIEWDAHGWPTVSLKE